MSDNNSLALRPSIAVPLTLKKSSSATPVVKTGMFVFDIPVVNVGNTSIILAAPGNSAVIAPNTSNFQGGNSTLGYTAILSDSTVADIQVTRALQNSVLPTTPRFVGDNEDAQSVAVAGFEFRIVAKTQMLEDKTASITIIANETGGSVTVNLTVKRVTTATN